MLKCVAYIGSWVMGREMVIIYFLCYYRGHKIYRNSASLQKVMKTVVSETEKEGTFPEVIIYGVLMRLVRNITLGQYKEEQSNEK